MYPLLRITTTTDSNIASRVHFEDMGNSFTDESFELVAIHTKDVMDAAVFNSVQTVLKIGEEPFQNFFREERFLREAHLLQIL